MPRQITLKSGMEYTHSQYTSKAVYTTVAGGSTFTAVTLCLRHAACNVLFRDTTLAKLKQLLKTHSFSVTKRAAH